MISVHCVDTRRTYENVYKCVVKTIAISIQKIMEFNVTIFHHFMTNFTELQTAFTSNYLWVNLCL